jgi:plasmid stabilization system protein ParE
MLVEFSPLAEGDLEAIADYIALDNPRRAVSFVRELHEQCQGVGKNPLLYRLRPEIGSDARLVAVGRYVILFRLTGQMVRIERVVHAARDLHQLLANDEVMTSTPSTADSSETSPPGPDCG